MVPKEESYKEIAVPVERFGEQFDSYKKPDYNETLTRRDFIDPFFKALGWDIDNKNGYAEEQERNGQGPALKSKKVTGRHRRESCAYIEEQTKILYRIHIFYYKANAKIWQLNQVVFIRVFVRNPSSVFKGI